MTLCYDGRRRCWRSGSQISWECSRGSLKNDGANLATMNLWSLGWPFVLCQRSRARRSYFKREKITNGSYCSSVFYRSCSFHVIMDLWQLLCVCVAWDVIHLRLHKSSNPPTLMESSYYSSREGCLPLAICVFGEVLCLISSRESREQLLMSNK